ncbi:MAG: BrnT family toxin [Nitrospirae bacterium]|uniref:BrnT family toxin n=1 Tax=Candidatus Magnetobacterium casense TaxID=1455061 RepID=UPI0009E04E57|nr:BrnT family toxin [Nitrospirota bacterium]
MFEWDEAKRQKNLDKHRLDFRDARVVFDGRKAVHVPAFKNAESRFASVAIVGEKFYTVVWTWREDRRRIISFRRSRDGEERAYRQIHG